MVSIAKVALGKYNRFNKGKRRAEMDTIVLRSDLYRVLEQNAQEEARSVSEIVNEAVEHYLREQQRAKLNREIQAYEALHAELQRKYLGQWVAVHNQAVVDHDQDRVILYRRIRAKYGRTAVLLRQVTEHPHEEIWLRTPSMGKVML
jgi:glutamyl-tRNA reductase